MYSIECFEKNELYKMEKDSYEHPITIGILICDLRQQMCRENIFNYLDHFNELSGRYINFYIPGYSSKNGKNKDKEFESQNNFRDSYNLNGETYYFDDESFYGFVYGLRQNHQIRYQGVPNLILVEVKNGRINWDKRIVFELWGLKRQGKEQTVYSFFEYIFEIAHEFVSIDDFVKSFRNEKLKESFFNVVKEKISPIMDKFKGTIEIIEAYKTYI